jgi:hypothetical protein
MSLVDDDRVAALGHARDLVDDEGELLEGRDDDARLLTHERGGELGGILVDLLDGAVGVLQLVDGVLELAVEHHTVGDDDNLVEHLLVTAVQGHEAVRQPSDRVRLARARRMLDQVAMPGAVLARVRLELQHRVPLMQPGEDQLDRPAALVLLDVNEAGQDVEPRVALPDPLPQICGPVAVGVGRVAGAEVVAEVEGKEARRCA